MSRSLKVALVIILAGFVSVPASAGRTASVSPPTIVPINSGNYVTSTTPDSVYFPTIGAGGCVGANTYPTTITAQDGTSAAAGFSFYLTPGVDLSSIMGGSAPTDSLSVDSSVNVLIEEDYSSYKMALVAPTPNTIAGYGAYGQYSASGGTVVVTLSLKDVGTIHGLCSQWNTLDGTVDCQSTGSVYSEIINIGFTKTDASGFNDPNSNFTQLTLKVASCASVNPTPLPTLSLSPLDKSMKLTVIGAGPTSDPVGIRAAEVFVDTASIPASTATIHLDAPSLINGGQATLDKLTNDTQYCVSMAYINNAGFISSPVIPTVTPVCATPSRIEGFLNRSTCFIASAAYGEEWDSRLELLRQFRDQKLLTSAAGRSFVEWYYAWSPTAARWMLKHSWAQSLTRAVLYPAVRAVRFLMDGGLLFLLAWLSLSVLAAVLVLRWRNRLALWIVLAFTCSILAAGVARAGPTDAASGTWGSAQPLPPDAEVVQPYIESLKAGKKLEPKVSKIVRQAAGISLSASSWFGVGSSDLQANAYDKVYGNGWVPSVDLFYEMQIWRNKVFGAFGPVFHLGFMVANGKGVFTKNGIQTGDVLFKFYAVPVSAGFGYHFTALRIIVPFVHAGGMVVPLMETRSDGGDSRKSITQGVEADAGVALNIDWISRKNAWDLYDSDGVLHSYLMAKVQNLTSIGGTLNYNQTAVDVGFLFEF